MSESESRRGRCNSEGEREQTIRVVFGLRSSGFGFRRVRDFQLLSISSGITSAVPAKAMYGRKDSEKSSTIEYSEQLR